LKSNSFMKKHEGDSCRIWFDSIEDFLKFCDLVVQARDNLEAGKFLMDVKVT